MQINTTEPLYLTSGDTVRWQRQDITSTYPGGTLSYTFVGAANPVTAVATADGTVTLTASQTTAMASGRWAFTASIVVAGERSTVARGTITVNPDPALGASGATNLSHARRVLTAIEATLEARATSADLDLRLSDGRRLMNVSHSELLTFRQHYRAEVAREDVSERLRRGEKPRNRLLVRLI